MKTIEKVNILKGKDFEDALEILNEELTEDIKVENFTLEEVEQIKEKVKKINGYIQQNVRFVLGFGRGYFAGDKEMKYLVEKDGEYYWLIRDYETDEHQRIYKIKKKKKKLLKFLEKNQLIKKIFDFKILLEEVYFWEMEEHPEMYKKISMEKFYELEKEPTEDREYLVKEYVASLQPGNYDQDYAHETFEREFKKTKKSLA